MTDPSEITALKAAVRGAVHTASLVSGLADRVEALDAHGELDGSLVDELSGVTTAHAVASAALRGIVETIVARRGSGAGG
jgi:hypothetical protein